jgi:hypothetical protein
MHAIIKKAPTITTSKVMYAMQIHAFIEKGAKEELSKKRHKRKENDLKELMGLHLLGIRFAGNPSLECTTCNYGPYAVKYII